MTASASASLTIKVHTLGTENLKALNAELSKLGQAAQRTASRGVGSLAKGVESAGRGAARAKGGFRTLEQEIGRLQQRMDQERITRKAREILTGPPGKPPILAKIRSVEDEMRRLQRVQDQRAATNAARERLGLPVGGAGGSLLAGHGFLHRGRQTLGLMRDMAVAGMGVRFAMASVAAGVGAAINPLRQFESTMAAVKVKGGFSADQMKAIASAARNVGDGQFSGLERGEAAVELAAAGLGAGAIAKQMGTVSQFAAAGGLSTERASAVLVETMSQFGKSADDFSRIGDVIVKSANMSTISVEDMAETFKYVGPVANTAGIALEELSAMTAMIGERGIKGSMAGTSLRGVITALVQPTKQARSALQELGLTKQDLQAGLSDIPAFLKQLDERMQGKGFNQAQRLSISKRLFGSEALATVEALISGITTEAEEGGTVWQRYRESVQGADGDMQKTAKTMGNTSEGKIRRMNAAVTESQIKLGEQLAPVLSDKIIPGLTDAAIATGKWVGKHGDLIATLATGIPAIAGTALAVNSVATVMGGVIKLAGTVGVTMGQSAGAAFGTSFLGAALPVLTAGLIGFGLGSMLAKLIDAEGIGKRIWEALHPGETYHTTQTIRQAMAADERGAPAPLIGSVESEDPVLRNLARAAAEAGPLAPTAGAPVRGKLEIEIRTDGRATVTDFNATGPLDLGVNLQ